MTAEQTFRAKAPGIMAQLMRDFPISVEDAAAILGNAGHESKGLTDDQEDNPTVPGSRGGLNWMQWTGPRRRAMEAYCARNRLDPSSDEAAYKWLFLELKGIEGSEGKAIAKTVAAKGLDAKVEAFEKAFLRAGIKHYPSRKIWAAKALDAWRNQPKEASGGIKIPNSTPIPTSTLPEPQGRPPIGVFIILIILAAAIGAAFFLFNR
jgi:hypothetical protein